MNLQNAENQGWEKMRQVLDREMPTQKQKKRRFIIWWQLAILLLGVFSISFALKTFLLENKAFTPKNKHNVFEPIFEKSPKNIAQNNITYNKNFVYPLSVTKQIKKATNSYTIDYKEKIQIKKAIISNEIELLKKINNKEIIAKNAITNISQTVDNQIVELLPLITKEIEMPKNELSISAISPIHKNQQNNKISKSNFSVFVAANSGHLSPFAAEIGAQYRLPFGSKKWDFWAGISCWAVEKKAENWTYLYPTLDVNTQTSTSQSIVITPVEEVILTHLFYANIPISSQYNFSKKMYITLTLNTSYLFGQRLESKTTGFSQYAVMRKIGANYYADPLANMSTNTKVLSQDFNAHDLGLQTLDFSVDCGIGYRFGKTWSTNLYYRQGLQNTQYNSYINNYNQFWQLQIRKTF